MEKLEFQNSIKNIALPSEGNYKLQLLEKIEIVIKRIRWKAIFQDIKKATSKPHWYSRTRSFTTPPPPLKELAAFEYELT